MQLNHCAHCGFILYADFEKCPKCQHDAPAFGGNRQGLYCVDVAHQRETLEQARSKILSAINYALKSNYKGIEIIHGYSTRQLKPFEYTISGMAQQLMRQQARLNNWRFSAARGNPGASILWFQL